MKILTKNCIVCGKEFIKKINISRRSWKHTKFCSQKCSNKNKVGKPTWNKYLKSKKCLGCSKLFQPRENKRKFCSRECSPYFFQKGNTVNKNRIQSEETKRKISETHKRKGIKPPCGGKNSFGWKGGISKENYLLRRLARYKNWRKAVFERDNYTCQECSKRGGKLHAHHIKSWEKYPELRFIVSNGITLCVPCHKQTDTYPKNLK